NEGPMTAEMLYEKLRECCPTIALSTVYRNLERFCAEGLIQKESLNDGVVRYTSCRQHGHYLVCTQCDKRIRLQSCPLTAVEEEIAKQTGFSIEGHSLTIYGKCPDCLRKASPDSSG